MATLQRLQWQPRAEGSTRRERSGCDFDVYLPDLLCDRELQIAGDVAADIADAEIQIAQFNARPSALSDTEGLARLLLRAEAVASSRIEGLEAGPRRVLRAEAAQSMGVASLDVGADEILGTIRAMQLSLDEALSEAEVTPEALLRIHAELMTQTKAPHAGRWRDEQNWIGGNNYNPCGAAYVPPPPERLEELIADLCRFCTGTDLSPIAQAGLAHAQFETIHPFVDGTGRTGRALIHLVLRRRGLATRFVPPISLILATWSKGYIGGLTAYRHLGPSDSDAANASANQWLATFAGAAQRAMSDAQAYEAKLHEIGVSWRQSFGPVRANSAVALLLDSIAAAPILTVATASQIIGRSFEATNLAVARLVEAEILQPITVGKRNRAFEAPQIIDALIGLERGLASPAGDTRSSPPARPVPRPRQ